MEPHGQARGPQRRYPTTPTGAETIRRATTKASSGHPPGGEIRRSRVMMRRKISNQSYAFLHGQGRGLLRRRMKENSSSNFGWVIVGISFVILALTYGVWYSFSVFFVALLREFGWSRSTGAGAFSLFIVIQSVVGPFAGAMVDRLGPRAVILSGSLLLGAGLALSSMIQTWWQFYLFFGVITAVGLGTTGWIANSTIVQQWFQEKRGLAVGIISAGIGVGILICTPVAQYLINRVGWRTTYLIMACVVPLVNSSMAMPFLKRPPHVSPLQPAEKTPSHTAITSSWILDKEWASRSWTVKDAMATKQFWLLTFSFFVTGISTQSILTHHVVFFVDKGLEPLRASYIVGMLGIVSMGGKILWGMMSDRKGREVTCFVGVVCAVCGLVSLITYNSSTLPVLPYSYAFFFGMGYAAAAVLPPIITADFFAGRSYGGIFGAIMVLNGLGGALGAWLAGFIHDHLHSYLLVFIIMIACFLAAGYAIWVVAPRKFVVVAGKRL
jgi:MFS family permease